MRRHGPRKADDGEARHNGDGKQSRVPESRKEGEKRPARFLTPRRSSGGGSQQQKSGEVAAMTATEVRRRK
jgi:hypothetical protein